MSPLSDEYLRSLEPETMRYDVTIFDDFVISVLPNGIKTWAFLYDYEGRKRRKTLGVYPDMSYEAAEDALDNARGMIVKLGDDIKDSPVEPDVLTKPAPKEAIVATPPPAQPPELRPAVLATRTRKRYHSRPYERRSGAKRYFALGLLCVLALAAAVIFVPRLGGGGTATNAAPTERSVPGRAAPKPIVAETATPAPTPIPGRAQPKPIVFDDTPSPAVEPTPTEPTPTEPTPTPEPEAAPPVASQPDVEPAPSVAPQPADNPAEMVVATVSPEPMPEPMPEPLAEPEPEPEPEPESEPTMPADTRQVASATPAGTLETPAPAAPIQTEATSTDGNVTRSIVTSDVADLEPVDNLGANITLSNGGFRTVFFFTELRNFTAGTIVHRWVYNGRVVADVPLRVNGGWRWRTYSSKDLLPGMTGEWSVSVIDGDGRELGKQEFRFDR